MYIVAMVLSGLTVIFSALGAFLGFMYLTAEPQGGHEGILYAAGVVITIPGLILGLIASLQLRTLRQKGITNRFGVRVRWLPLGLPVLVVIALNVMLLFK